MNILKETPTEHKPTTSDLQHISEILPQVLHGIIMSTQARAAQRQDRPDTRGLGQALWRRAA